MTSTTLVNNNSSNHLLTLPDIEQKKKELIQNVAYNSLKEIGVTFLYASTSACFAVSAASVATFFAIGAIVCLANSILRYGSVSTDLALFALRNNQSKKAIEEKEEWETLKSDRSWLRAVIFSAYDSCTRDLLIHEGGHFLAANAVYLKSRAIIVLNFFGCGGYTEYTPWKLTKFGKWLEPNHSHLFVTAAGPGLATIFSAINIGIAHKCQKTNPELSRYLNLMAILSIANHVMYALSAYFINFNGHDFVELALGGISPIASAVSIVALPLIVKVGLYLMTS